MQLWASQYNFLMSTSEFWPNYSVIFMEIITESDVQCINTKPIDPCILTTSTAVQLLLMQETEHLFHCWLRMRFIISHCF